MLLWNMLARIPFHLLHSNPEGQGHILHRLTTLTLSPALLQPWQYAINIKIKIGYAAHFEQIGQVAKIRCFRISLGNE
jgi:hypothetical protein